MPSNHFVKVGNKVEFIKHTSIEDYFISNPIKWKSAIDSMSELFISTLSNYIPSEHFYITFTGGFDGRTSASVH